jgi:type I protein arginine methyltransferase
VDTVELKAVVTNPYPLKVGEPIHPLTTRALICIVQHIDLRTAKKEDLTFRAPFTLQATRNDCMFVSATRC